MKLIFALAVSLFQSQPAHAYQVLRSELHQLHWQQTTLLAGFTAPSEETYEKLDVVSANGKKVSLHLWKTDGASRGLYFVIPGTGSGGKSRLANRLAQMLTGLNYDAVVIANPFSDNFQVSFSSDGLVGLPEKDATDAVAMMKTIQASYAAEYGQPREINVVGFSLGGLFAPLTARNISLHINRVIALDPPIDFNFAIKQVDRMIAKMLEKPRTLAALARDLLGIFRLAPHGLYEDNSARVLSALPQDDDENEQLIGMAFFPSLQKITSNLANTWAFNTPEKAEQLRSIRSTVTFSQYTGLVAAPLSRDRRYAGLTVPQILKRIDLRAVLRGNPDVASRTYVITNRDDLLVTDSMLSDLDAIIPGRLTVFDAGGHCGNYWTKSFLSQFTKIVTTR
jgi:pimeloyl-ACP methyl ester carboxylesterase